MSLSQINGASSSSTIDARMSVVSGGWPALLVGDFHVLSHLDGCPRESLFNEIRQTLHFAP
jgi:hypothetical protein